jgi:hypothetical protein
MTNDEYDELYCDALKTLAHSNTVAKPFVQADGSRICQVGERLLNENEVFEQRWGKRIAAIIQRNRWTRHAVAFQEGAVSGRSNVPARMD